MNLLESAPHGDPHNFGKFVQRTQLGADRFFNKPRTVFWENLFFGETSPLKPLFSEPTSLQDSVASPTFADFFFNLSYCEQNENSGVACEFQERSVESSAIAAYAYGSLIFYSFFWGILDLHGDNLKVGKLGLQVVDAEAVLGKATLPEQTLLLPTPQVPLEKSSVFKLSGICSPSEIYSLVPRGFLDCAEATLNKLPQISNSLNHALNTLPYKPKIRAIIRNTQAYREYPIKPLTPPLAPSELIQLKRGDIPYFFKFLGEDRLFHYTNVDGDYAPSQIPTEYFKSTPLVGASPDQILSRDRILEHIVPVGAFMIARKMLDHKYLNNYGGNQYEFSVNEESLTLRFFEKSFQANRHSKTERSK